MRTHPSLWTAPARRLQGVRGKPRAVAAMSRAPPTARSGTSGGSFSPARHAACYGVRASRAPGCGVATTHGIALGCAAELQSGAARARPSARSAPPAAPARPGNGTNPGARGIEPVAPGAAPGGKSARAKQWRRSSCARRFNITSRYAKWRANRSPRSLPRATFALTGSRN